jgi:Alpha/beta hydrolase domain
MSQAMSPKLRKSTLVAAAVAAALGLATSVDARVTRIIVDTTTASAASVDGVAYQTLTGRAFGELDPKDAHNTLITDIGIAPTNANGNVAYIATFTLTMPTDVTKASGLVWHDVPNRGGKVGLTSDLKGVHDIELDSGWQGDNAGANPPTQPGTTVPANAASLAPITPTTNDWVKTPVLTGVTGRLLGRIVNRSGTAPAPLNVMGNPIPYFPADLSDTSSDTLTVHAHETVNGIITEGDTVPRSSWKYCAAGGTFDSPGVVAKLPVNVCMKSPGFDASKLYQLVYTVKDPYVLGTGTAAFRDVMSFFRYANNDDFGTANPLKGVVKKAVIRGVSQSGNFTRHFIFLGMNEDEQGRIVHDGAWPLIAGRRVANNSRWGQPDGVLELYQMGSEGPQWWHSFPDQVRDLHPGGILDRCENTNTCPKIIETFGGSEVFALKMTTSWVGTDPKNDIPLPRNVRRYYLPSSTHGGGNGAMDEHPDLANVSNCPGNNWGKGTMPTSPVPSAQLVNRMKVAMRDWLLNGIEPPPSKWPQVHGPRGERTLVDANMQAMGFPHGVPGIPDSIFLPENFVFPVFDYDWGPQFDEFNATGTPTNEPPPIKHVIKMLVPAVDSDGNELGGVPTVLRDAPLGTYLGWNITASGFHAGQVCNYVGGWTPFAIRPADKQPGDPRPSLQERYGNHDGYVAAVVKAANNAACKGYLLAGSQAAAMGAACTTSIPTGFPDDWVQVVTQAMNSNVLR